MARCATWLVLAVSIAIGAYVTWIMTSSPPEMPAMLDEWWGAKSKPSDVSSASDVIKEFRLNVSDSVLQDLQQRIKSARVFESLPGTNFEYGFNTGYMSKLVKYWTDKYDWRKQEAVLNSMAQYTTNIEGIDVHFIRIKPKKASGTPKALLMVHGWPGSIWEFYKLIPMLVDPAHHGGQDSDALEIVCPSIPGYAFSEQPHKPGFDQSDTARIFYKLMTRLGHNKFYVHGGDWGGVICTIMAQAYPEHVSGIHVNFAAPPLNGPTMFKQLIGAVLPCLMYTDQEAVFYANLPLMFERLLRETGYMHLHSTKPDTIAFALNDSPVGLAAYILEKFSTWSNDNNRMCDDGCLTKHFTEDELLTNVMIYWLTGSISSSMRFYKEYFISDVVKAFESLPVTVPSGIASFPHELVPHARTLVESKFKDIVRYTDMPRGGHFAAFEVPALMANDIQQFVKIVEHLATPGEHSEKQK